jgi:hydrogenase maturation protease
MDRSRARRARGGVGSRRGERGWGSDSTGFGHGRDGDGRERWEELERQAPEEVFVDGVPVRRGSRVRLRPRPGREIWDSALDGRTAIVDGVEEDVDGTLHVLVSLDDLLAAPRPGQRFFFAPDEVEPLAQTRVLVAGIGNVFLGDDGFGCEVAARLAATELSGDVDVADFGIRGMDLAYTLREYDAAILVDATPRGEPPGTLSVIEPDPDETAAEIETHGMDPVRVLRLARELGGAPPRTLVVGCEPATIPDPDEGEVVAELSDAVRAAVDEAIPLVRSLVEELLDEQRKGGEK